MSEVLRLYRYKGLLNSKRALSAEDLMARLEISRATLKRDLAKLRDQLHVSLRFDRDLGGYVIDGDEGGDELPGLWFSPEELLSLATIQQLLAQLEPGLLAGKLEPLQARLAELMEKHGLDSARTARKVRIVHAGKRVMDTQAFETIARATMEGRRLRLVHFNRQNGKRVEREVSPQRLVHYRDNWYVDAWCHLRNDLRSFAIDAIEQPSMLANPAQEVDPAQVDEWVSAAYGIFAGRPKAWARLRFTPERARWVAHELWHPQQEARLHPDGSYELAIPYADDREIIGDILRFGPDVQVIGPQGLRQKVQQRLLATVGRYVHES